MHNDATAAAPTTRNPSAGRGLLGRLLRHPPAVIGVILLAAFLLMAIFAPYLAPHDPAQPQLGARLTPPAWSSGGLSEYLLGTDHVGRDLLSRLIYGSRIALIVGFGGVTIAAVIGVILGLLAGYFGGRLDSIIMRIVDTVLAIPNILLYLTVLAVFGQSLMLLIAVIGCINWTSFARVVRAEAMALRNREFVEASKALGQRSLAIIARHVLPNSMAPIIVIVTLNIATIIILEASLSYLGFGVRPPTVTWGRMLADGRNYIATAWWLASFPGLMITALALSLIFIGDWLRDVLDPRTRSG